MQELFVEPVIVQCGHVFCKGCIQPWLKKKTNCPVCRGDNNGAVVAVVWLQEIIRLMVNKNMVLMLEVTMQVNDDKAAQYNKRHVALQEAALNPPTEVIVCWSHMQVLEDINDYESMDRPVK